MAFPAASCMLPHAALPSRPGPMSELAGPHLRPFATVQPRPASPAPHPAIRPFTGKRAHSPDEADGALMQNSGTTEQVPDHGFTRFPNSRRRHPSARLSLDAEDPGGDCPRRAPALAPDGGHGPAARGGHVRRHGAGTAADGLRSEHRHPDVGGGHADLLLHRARPGAQLSGLELCLHQRGDRGDRLCRRRAERQSAGGAGRDHRLRGAVRADRADRQRGRYALDRTADAAGGDRCRGGGDRPESGAGGGQGRQRQRFRPLDVAGHGAVRGRCGGVCPWLHPEAADSGRAAVGLCAVLAANQCAGAGHANRFRAGGAGAVDRAAALHGTGVFQ